jgi:branched-chain amino acid transport system substrate-binding protein
MTILKTFAASAAAVFMAAAAPASAQAPNPIKVGFSMTMTGNTAPAGQQVLLALQIWRDDVNAKGGLLGRPVELVYYDDQGSPANAPGIYSKLVDVDKVDLLLGPYGTNVIAAALPALAPRNLTTIGMFGVASNHEINYKNYFSMIPYGENAIHEFTRGFFEVAMAQDPKPKTIAILGADAEFGKNATDGARANAKAAGLQIVYDRLYPPTITDLTPVVRAVKAANPDIVFVSSYPPDTVGFIRAAAESGLSPKLMGGTMIGLLATPLRMQLGPLMNGYVNAADVFVPGLVDKIPGAAEAFAKYRERAKGQKIDPFGYTFLPFGYGAGQVLAQAVEGTKSLDHQKIADYIRSNTFKTIAGDVAFGKNGEWAKPRPLLTQWQNVTGNDIGQVADPKNWVVIWPNEYATGKLIYPYDAAKKQ